MRRKKKAAIRKEKSLKSIEDAQKQNRAKIEQRTCARRIQITGEIDGKLGAEGRRRL